MQVGTPALGSEDGSGGDCCSPSSLKKRSWNRVAEESDQTVGAQEVETRYRSSPKLSRPNRQDAMGDAELALYLSQIEMSPSSYTSTYEISYLQQKPSVVDGSKS